MLHCADYPRLLDLQYWSMHIKCFKRESSWSTFKRSISFWIWSLKEIFWVAILSSLSLTLSNMFFKLTFSFIILSCVSNFKFIIANSLSNQLNHVWELFEIGFLPSSRKFVRFCPTLPINFYELHNSHIFSFVFFIVIHQENY